MVTRPLYWTYDGPEPEITITRDGTYPITLVATDSRGASSSLARTLQIENVAPFVADLSVTPTSAVETTEVKVTGKIVDPGADQVRVFLGWSDGSPGESRTYNAGDTFSFTHTYTDDPPGDATGYDVFVTVADETNRGVRPVKRTVTVTNAAPTVRVNGVRMPGGGIIDPVAAPTDVRIVDPGGTVELRALIRDPGPADTSGTLTVDWGDGSGPTTYPYPCTDPACENIPTERVACSLNEVGSICEGTKVLLRHTYDGVPAGSEVDITVTAADDDGGSSTPLTTKAYVRSATHAIVFPSLVDVPLTQGQVTPGATASSGLPVTFTASGACVASGGQVVLQSVGTCSVTASQPGNLAWPAASPVTRTFNVTTPLTVTAPSRSIVVGQPVGALIPQVTGFVNGDDGVDLTTLPACTSLVTPTTPPGTYPVTCSGGAAPSYYTFDTYTPGAITVSKAGTTTTASIKAGLVSASVAVNAPGGGAPSGTLTFRRGATLLGTFPVGPDGAAALPDPMPAGPLAIAVEYSGDGSFLGSSGSTARQDPSLRADVVPGAGVAGRANAAGWFRVRPEVRFACVPGSAPLTAPCPATVAVGDGQGQAVSRTIVAEDGGTASAIVTGLNVDTLAPALRVTGLANRARYSGQPTAVSCRAVDGLSGAAGCSVSRTLLRAARAPSYEAVWRFSAVGFDVAGNRTSVTGTYAVRAAYLVGASVQRNGTTRVNAGQYYVLQTSVGVGRAPRLLYQVPAGARFETRPGPAGPLLSRNPQGLWETAVRLPARAGQVARFWNVGVQDRASGRVYVVTMDLGPRR